MCIFMYQMSVAVLGVILGGTHEIKKFFSRPSKLNGPWFKFSVKIFAYFVRRIKGTICTSLK